MGAPTGMGMASEMRGNAIGVSSGHVYANVDNFANK